MKKGISLVILIITVIIMIILTTVVVLNKKQLPSTVDLAVFLNDVSMVQEVVDIAIMNNMTNATNEGIINSQELRKARWKGIIKENDGTTGFASTHTVNGIEVAVLDGANLSNQLSISAEEVEKYGVDEQGKVYYIEGAIINGVTYYNRDTTIETPGEGGTSGGGDTSQGGSTIGNGTLASVIDIGDFIAYDCGNWTGTADMPTANGAFGGYTEGISKSTSIEVESKKCQYSGWRVLSINRNETPDNYTDDIIALIHAGVPAVMYCPGYVATYKTDAITFAQSNFVNSTYANDATIFDKATYDIYHATSINGATVIQNVTTIGVDYWTFERYALGTTNGYNNMYYISYNGRI